MKVFSKRRKTLKDLEQRLQDSIAQIPAAVEKAAHRSRSRRLVATAAWIAGGVGVLSLGLIAGRELRGRYKFNRRTPYDYYAHSGDRAQDLEFGVGI